MNDRHFIVTRRDFMRGGASAALGASVAQSSWGCPASRSSLVVVVRDQNALGSSNEVNIPVLKQMLAQTVMGVTGARSELEAWRTFFKPEDLIGLVPTPHLNPTHRELVDAVRSSLIEAGIPDRRIRRAQGGPDEAKACSALICLPGLKAHWLTGIGTVLKNYITYSGNPSQYHDENSVRLGEIWNLPHVKGKTKLVLVDALRPLCDKGPQPDPRYMWRYCGLIAGKDPVAVETVCLKIITAKRQALRGEHWPLSPPPFCVAAADEKYGLGTSKIAEIRLEQLGWTQDNLV